MIKYSVEPSDKPQFEHMLTCEKDGRENVICYINPIFQQDKSIAFMIKKALDNSNLIPDLTI